jgi:hypothetical protein
MFLPNTVLLGFLSFLFILLDPGMTAESQTLVTKKNNALRNATKDIMLGPDPNMPIESQAPLKKPNNARTESMKEWATVDGFRSAKFGMGEKQVLRAIAKDFKVPKSKVKRLITSKYKTISFIIHLEKLMEVGGAADIIYYLGYKSKRLMQVSIGWGETVTKNYSAKEVINAANVLRNHFIKKRYQKESYAVNGKINKYSMVVFRGLDKKGQMVFLRLKSFNKNDKDHKKEVREKARLDLIYIQKPKKRDVFQNATDTTKGEP